MVSPADINAWCDFLSEYVEDQQGPDYEREATALQVISRLRRAAIQAQTAKPAVREKKSTQ